MRVLVALEPAPQTVRYLVRNLAANHIANYRALPVACTARDGYFTLYERGHDLCHTTVPQIGSAGQRPRALATVPGVSLQCLFSAESIEACELMKFNCEGAEFDVLPATSPRLTGSIRNLCTSFLLDLEDAKTETFEQLLIDRGFTIRKQVTYGSGGYLYTGRGSEQCEVFRIFRGWD